MVGKKARLTARIDPAILERLRDYCYHERVSLASQIEAAITAHLAGKRIPRRKGELRPGRLPGH